MISSRFGRASRGLIALIAALVGLLLLAVPAAVARYAYVANTEGGSVSVIDAATGSVAATIALAGEPDALAIKPDGSRVYVANAADGTVTVIDTATNAVTGTPIKVGKEPRGIAITPDGSRAYVTDFGEEAVSVIDTATNTVVGTIKVGKEPDGIAISPDGSHAFAAQQAGDIAVIDTSTNLVTGSVTDPRGPTQIAIGPRGSRAFVTDKSGSVTAFNPANNSLAGAPIGVAAEPDGIAITPDGLFAYVASPKEGLLTPIDTTLDAAVGAPIAFPGATALAISPDGLQGYVTNGAGNSVGVLDRTRNAAAGTITVGAKPTAVAFVPNQGPHASFWVSPTKRRAKQKLTFHANASSDPDGTIATYAWDFGDGTRVKGSSPTRVHRYKQPGTYQVTLAVTDNEECSSQVVFTGQTVSCNGSTAAIASSPLTVSDATGPILRLAGAERQRLSGRVIVFARCPLEACSFQARGAVAMTVVRPSGLRRSRHRLSPVTVSVPSTSWRRLALRVPRGTRRAALRALLSGGSARAIVTVLATDTGGDQSLGQRKIALIRPRHR